MSEADVEVVESNYDDILSGKALGLDEISTMNRRQRRRQRRNRKR